MFNKIRLFFVYKDMWLSAISFWIVLLVFSILGLIGDMENELGPSLGLALILIPVLLKMWNYRKKNVQAGKKLFLSKVGYCTFGIVIGLIILSLIFNLQYESGWADFTDFGFYIISLPLSSIIHLTFDSDQLSNRLLLYIVVFFNLSIITFLTDLLGLLVERIMNAYKYKKK